MEGREGDPAEDGSAKRARKTITLTEEELQARVQAALLDAARRPVPPALQETFTPNDPVHGLMHLPAIVKVVVDTNIFQRMRQIKQLGICHYVYPGAVHTRFFHSIGTAFLAHELIKGLRHRQPELGVTDREAVCVLLAALCHDLGHPCYSHMFEVFLHTIGRERRRKAEADARQRGLPGIPADQEEDIKRCEEWNHEAASVMLLQVLFEELKGPLEQAGLRADAEGDDFALVGELIDPPKKKLEALLDAGQLRQGWAGVIKGRPVEKAWLYEIVSNWRSGIDVDKFDYFRRDALFLGIQRQFDHDRYLLGVRVIWDAGDGVPTISPPEKDKDMLRESMYELRKMLHRCAYQHKTVKKIELHMIDILMMMDEHVTVTGMGGKKMRMSEAALSLDPVAYPKLTDTFVEARLFDGEDPLLERAHQEFELRVNHRALMRLVADWDLPRAGESGGSLARLPDPQAVVAGVLEHYQGSSAPTGCSAQRKVAVEDLRCQVAKFHYGMGSKDPITRVLFFSRKAGSAGRKLEVDEEAKPLRQKIFVFWNPVDAPSDDLTLRSLTKAFHSWAKSQVEESGRPQAPKRPLAASPPPARPRRALKIQASLALSPTK